MEEALVATGDFWICAIMLFLFELCGDCTREKFMDAVLLDDLARLGLDTHIGIKYCGDVDFYMDVLRITVSVANEKIDKIIKCLKEEDYSGYTMVVHSLKSSTANIGAMNISKLAKELEYAGKIGDNEYILSNNDKFIQDYQFLMGELAKLLNVKEKETVVKGEKSISLSKWNESICRMKYYLEELELDLADELADELLLYDLSEELFQSMISIKEHLQRFDVESVKEILMSLEAPNLLS